MSNETTMELTADAVSSTEGGEWTIELYDLRGECIVNVETMIQWRPKQSKIALYKGSPPSDPNKSDANIWWVYGDSDWNTGKPWGPGWSAALIAMDGSASTGGSYHYIAKTEVTA